MAFNAKTNWVENEAVTPGDFNRIEQGIKDADTNKVDKVSGKGLSTNDYTTAEKNKLTGIAAGANNYAHPSTHPPSIISQNASNRFVTDSEKSTWNGKAPSNHASGTSTYGVGTASAYGHNKVINHLESSLFVNGESLAAYQGKVLDEKIETDRIVRKAYNTSGTNVAYTITAPEIEELYDGLMITIIPHVTSNATHMTLNVNGLGAYPIMRYVSPGTMYFRQPFINTSAIYANQSILLRFASGISQGEPINYWIAVEFTKPGWHDIEGKPNDLMQTGTSQTMSAQLTAGGTQAETTSQTRNIVVMPSGTTDFSPVPNNTLIFVKE